MGKYQKRPLIVEAFQWTGGHSQKEDPVWIVEAIEKGDAKVVIAVEGVTLEIRTLEGIMTAQPGDYIIQGIQGEIYPCKQDIFEASYQSIDYLEKGKYVNGGRLNELRNGDADRLIDYIKELEIRLQETGEGLPTMREDVAHLLHPVKTNDDAPEYDISEMSLTMEALEAHAVECIKRGEPLQVLIAMPGYVAPELISNPPENIPEKMNYYRATYDENCHHRHAPGIRIVAVGVK